MRDADLYGAAGGGGAEGSGGDAGATAETAGEAVIEACGLQKSYGAVEAVRGVDLRVPRGFGACLAAGALMFFVSLGLLERRDF